jgi:hypothetical protein
LRFNLKAFAKLRQTYISPVISQILRIVFAIALVKRPACFLFQELLAGHSTALGASGDIVGANSESLAQLVLA